MLVIRGEGRVGDDPVTDDPHGAQELDPVGVRSRRRSRPGRSSRVLGAARSGLKFFVVARGVGSAGVAEGKACLVWAGVAFVVVWASVCWQRSWTWLTIWLAAR